jgi:pyoverdine/dityrosine biosynthesis protein Dit1
MSDGRVFADLIGVPDAAVKAYEQELKRLARAIDSDRDAPDAPVAEDGAVPAAAASVTAPASADGTSEQKTADSDASGLGAPPSAVSLSRFLSWDSLDRHLPQCGGDGDAIRAHLVANWETADAMAELDRAIASDGDIANVYRGFLQFLTLDRDWTQMRDSGGKPYSRTRIKRECAAIARKMMVRNQAFSLLVSERYPRAIRLSIHAHNNAGPKFGVRLLRDLKYCSTPWHNCVVQLADGREVLMKRCEAEALPNMSVVQKYGRPWCFRQTDAAQNAERTAAAEAAAATSLPTA